MCLFFCSATRTWIAWTVAFVFCAESVDYSASPIGIVVVTSTGRIHRERVRVARATWAKHQAVIFISSDHGIDYGHGIEAVPCSSDSDSGACCKTLLGISLALVKFPSAKWLVRVSDETFVFAEQLLNALTIFNPRSLILAGCVALLTACTKEAGVCGEAHPGGAAGFVLSRPLAVELLRHRDLFSSTCQDHDRHVGHFFRYALDVHVRPLPGAWQEPRFENLTWVEHHGSFPACSPPGEALPPSVLSRLGASGSLFPISPVDAGRLVLLHCDSRIWPRLAELPKRIRKLKLENQALLVYLDTQGAATVGPRFNQLKTLSICVHEDVHRAKTFGVAAWQLSINAPTSQSSTLLWAQDNGYSAEIQDVCNPSCGVVETSDGYAVFNVSEYKHHVESVRIQVTVTRQA